MNINNHYVFCIFLEYEIQKGLSNGLKKIVLIQKIIFIIGLILFRFVICIYRKEIKKIISQI